MNIRHLRSKAGLTQKEFGERLGVQSQTILKYEKNERKIPQTILKLIQYEFAEYLEGEGLKVKIREEDTRPTWEMFSEISEENHKLKGYKDQVNKLKVEVNRLNNLKDNNNRDYKELEQKLENSEKINQLLKENNEILKDQIRMYKEKLNIEEPPSKTA